MKVEKIKVARISFKDISIEYSVLCETCGHREANTNNGNIFKSMSWFNKLGWRISDGICYCPECIKTLDNGRE